MIKIRYVPIPGSNIGALAKFFDRMSVQFEELLDYGIKDSFILIPGVGNCRHHLDVLAERGFTAAFFESNKLITICAGFQIMCQFVEESQSDGLGLLDYDVLKLSSDTQSMSINTGFKEASDGNRYFFNHSFGVFVDGVERQGVFTSTFGPQKIISHVVTENGLHCQFHPELSGECGVTLIKNFLNIGSNNG